MQAAELHKKLFENANVDWRANDIAQKVAEEKQREMDQLLNRYPPPPPPNPLNSKGWKLLLRVFRIHLRILIKKYSFILNIKFFLLS